MNQQNNPKKFFDIKPPSKNNKAVIGIVKNERNEILKDLIKLEIQEQDRKILLEELKPKQEIVWSLANENFDLPRRRLNSPIKLRKGIAVFVIFSLMVSLIIPGFVIYGKAQTFKRDIMDLAGGAIENIKQASVDIASSNFDASIQEFQSAQEKFSQGNKKLKGMGASVFKFFDRLPGLSLIPAAQRVFKAGEYLTGAAKELISVAGYFIDNDFDVYSSDEEDRGENTNSLVNAIIASKDHLKIAREKIISASQEIGTINKKGLGSSFGSQLEKFKLALAQIQTQLVKSDEYVDALLKILGNDTPKLYLFIFQNNQELRATGGFIGTYGLFKIDNGHIEKVLVDGIYNPDGQLKEKVIPPFPLWKISPNWGLRDANWFADFPTSAKKIVGFYEKTGGPTVDGVISLTPTVTERLLKVIGPIEMPDYDVTVTADNFIEVTQKKVELDYDKQENKPKQFLTDLTPIVLEKIFSAPKEKLPEIFKTFGQNLKERHIMLYFLNEDLENLTLEENLGGALRQPSKDYLSVVNSNIDGRKTDGVIDNEIYHQARIQQDGSIIDTVTIKRIHKGGQEQYDWWNAENKDFVRVYVPQASEFLEANGFSKETPAPLLGVDYAQYKKDDLWSSVEQTLRQDEKSGTWIFGETGKTVFGNWIYTGPGKTSEVSFKYRLPFKIDGGLVKDYSLLVQKQAGTISDKLFASFELGDDDTVVWQYPELKNQGKELKYESVLDVDKFYGLVLSRK